jgi:hypothetical protein
MKRRVWNIVAVGSLLVSVVAAGLWVHGQFGTIRISWADGNVYRALKSDSGKFVSVTEWGGRSATVRFGPRVEAGGARQRGGAHLNGEWYGRFGFGTVDVVEPPWTCRQTWIPCWAVVAAGMVVPAAWIAFVAVPWVWRLRAELARRRVGLCGRCGYDMRASKERCPECGTMVMGEVAA